ncbi:uncharacterized protein LOC124371581 [Homalodisca vitripennis]|uniref:uncharacterized protein LOC124371581 n=1 Tax=Homalodisca vitripennis TaxID=197043 RepID=UPI001EEAFD81|nr:uncharacterized protein LOC124371581 [Homalodisca vitripennis]
MLRSYVGTNHRNWDGHVAQLGFALRTATHESTGFSPAYLNFGRELSATGDGFDILRCEDLPAVEDTNQYCEKLKGLRELYQVVSRRLEESHQRGAHRYNLRRRAVEFRVRDLVLKRNFAQSDAANFFSAKLTPRYVGPYVVAARLSPTVYALEDQQGKRIGNWHVSDLKSYQT